MLTEALVDDKLIPALRALDEIDPKGRWNMLLRAGLVLVIFLPDVLVLPIFFGRLGDRAIVLDWKFGDGVAVEVEETASYSSTLRRLNVRRIRLGFQRRKRSRTDHCPAALRQALGDGPARVDAFEKELAAAVKIAKRP